jgi:tetratricopeptide (TPR) repeat protein
MGEYKKALTDYDQALASNGEASATIYLNRGLALLEMKNFEEAKLSLMQAQELNPDSLQIRKLLEEVAPL